LEISEEIDKMNERETLKINAKGHLEIGGADACELATKFGTPLYVFDEAYIRKMMSVYRDTLKTKYAGDGLVLYASKAFSCQAMYRIADEDDLYSTGYFDRLGGKGIVVTEWSELIDGAIPADAYRLRIEKAGETERKFTLC
jgi:hypothetical protein